LPALLSSATEWRALFDKQSTGNQRRHGRAVSAGLAIAGCRLTNGESSEPRLIINLTEKSKISLMFRFFQFENSRLHIATTPKFRATNGPDRRRHQSKKKIKRFDCFSNDPSKARRLLIVNQTRT